MRSLRCTCGACRLCRKRAAMRAKRARQPRARVPYVCICGRAGARGGCKRCGMSWARYGYVREPRRIQEV